MSEEVEPKTDEEKAAEWAEKSDEFALGRMINDFAASVLEGKNPGHRSFMPDEKPATFVLAATTELLRRLDEAQNKNETSE